MRPHQEHGRISTAQVDGQVVVRVTGAELFDLVDDHCTDHMASEFLVRFPKTGIGTLEQHELIFPADVSLEDVLEVLDLLPADEVSSAQLADDAV